MEISKTKSNNRMAWLDTIRVFAGVAIIGVHSSADAMGGPFSKYAMDERIFPVLFRSLVYVARSELFIIISLFLLIMSLDRKPRDYVSVVKTQAKRLLIPFVFWVIFYAFWRLIKANYFGYADNLITDMQSTTTWLGYFVLGDVQYHMHFLPTLFGVAIMFPLYRLAVNRPEIGLVVLFCLAAKLSIDQFMWGNLAKEPYFQYLLRFVKILTYAGYGMVAASFYGILKRDFNKTLGKQIGMVAIFIGIVLFALKLVLSYKVILAGKWIYGYAPGYWADFLMPAVLFLVFMSFRHLNWPSVFSKIAQFSFGLYLLHPAILDMLEIGLSSYEFAPAELVIVKFALALTGTATVVFIISKISLLSWTIGIGDIPFFRSGKQKPSENQKPLTPQEA